jgi:DNA anti-recombination protein RmuC
MAQTGNVIQEGVDRFRDAFGSFEDELARVQKQLQARRKKIEKRFETGRKDLEKRFASERKRIERRTQKLRSELGKNPAVKRLDTMRKDATRQFEQGVTDVLGALQIASKSDLQRIDRKISQLNKKLKEMDGAKGNGRAKPTA